MVLTGNEIKDSYKALLNLENNSIITTALQRVQDGLGNDTPFQISDTKMRIDKLEIDTLQEFASSVKSLVEDSATGEIGYRTVSSFGGIDVTVPDGSNPTISIVDEVGGGGSIQILGGPGLAVTAESDVITISQSVGPQTVLTSATTLTAAQSGGTFHLQLHQVTGFDISLPPVAAGLRFRFVIEIDSAIKHRILADSSESDYFYGKTVIADDSFTDVGTQSVGRAVANPAHASYNAYGIGQTTDYGGINGDVIEFNGRDGSGWHVNTVLGSNHGGVIIATPIEAQSVGL